MERKEKAALLKRSGYNCCQAVLEAFIDAVNIDEAALMKLGAPFGAGMATMDATCGALCGAQMILGMKLPDGAPAGRAARELHAGFKKKCGAVDCGELKGVKTGKVLCSCEDCVKNAVELLEKALT